MHASRRTVPAAPAAPAVLMAAACLASGLVGWTLGRAGAPRGEVEPAPQARAAPAPALPAAPGPRAGLASAPEPAAGLAACAPSAAARADAGAPPERAARPELAELLLPRPGVALNQEQLAAAARLLVALGESERACALLEPGCFEDPDLAVELGEELLERGEHDAATRVLLAGLRVDPSYDGTLDALARVAPRRALETLERELAAMPPGVGRDDEDLARNRARLLVAVGRPREALAAARPLATLVREGSGCVPTGPQGAAWEWDAWEAVDPRGVEALLVRFLGEHSDHTREFGLRRLVGLLAREGRRHEARALCERFEQDGGSREEVAELLIELDPSEGWRRMEALAEDRPGRYELAWRVGDHLVESGRRDEALARWQAVIDDNWDEPEVVLETIERDRAALEPALDRRVRELERALAAAKEDEEWDPLWNLYHAAEVAWRLGRRADARRWIERVRSREPEDAYWYWILRRMDAGIDPF